MYGSACANKMNRKQDWKKFRRRKPSKWKQYPTRSHAESSDKSAGNKCDKVVIRRANLLMLIHERNCLILNNKISESSNEMSDAGKGERTELDRMYGCTVCRDGGHLWMGRNAQVLVTHFNQQHRGQEGEFNMMTHQYYEEDKVRIREYVTAKKFNGARPKVAKTPSGKGMKPSADGKDIEKIALELLGAKGEVTEDTISHSASGLTPNVTQESQLSQMSSQTFSPIAASTRNSSGIDATITISSDSSAASSEASVKIINGIEHNVMGRGRGKKHGLESIDEDSDDEENKKQKLSEGEIDRFSHAELNKGLKKALLQDKADKVKRNALYGGGFEDDTDDEDDGAKADETLTGLMNNTLDEWAENMLAEKDVINVEPTANDDTFASEGREIREQNEFLTEMHGQLKSKQDEVDGIRVQLQEKEYQVSEMKSTAKKRDLMIEQLNEKLKKHEELEKMLEKLSGGANDSHGNIVKRLCEELVSRKSEITKLKEELQEETKEKNKLRTMYEQATAHVSLLTGANKQKEAEVREIRRTMVCPQVKEGGWCQLPENQCDYKHPPPRSEQGCRWNYPKHAGVKARRCKKKDCEFKHDPSIQKNDNKNEGGNKDQDSNDVHMMDDDEKKEKEKEDAEKKRRIEERKVKRAQRKLNKLNSKGAVGSGDGTNNPKVPKSLLQTLPQKKPLQNNFQAQFENFQGRFNHPPPQLPPPAPQPQPQLHVMPPQVQQVQQVQQGYVQPQQQALQQQIPVLPPLQPRYGQVANQEQVAIQNLPQPVPIISQQAVPNQAPREPFTLGQLDNVVNDSVNQGNQGFEINWSSAPPPFPQKEGRVNVQHPPSMSNGLNTQGRAEQGRQQAIPSYNAQRIRMRQELEKEKEIYQRQKEEEERERLRIQNVMIRERQNQLLLQQQYNQIQNIQDSAVQYLPNQGQQQGPTQQQQFMPMGQQNQQGMQQHGHRYM